MPTLDTLTKAKGLFDRFLREKPLRYNPHSHFKLDNVVDAQLGRDSQTARNCLGLTVLYNCLLRRMGIVALTLYLENAFGIGPHVLIILQTEESLIDIENILPDKFDYKGHLNDPSRTRWGDRELVADIYDSFGNDSFKG